MTGRCMTMGAEDWTSAGLGACGRLIDHRGPMTCDRVIESSIPQRTADPWRAPQPALGGSFLLLRSLAALYWTVQLNMHTWLQWVAVSCRRPAVPRKIGRRRLAAFRAVIVIVLDVLM